MKLNPKEPPPILFYSGTFQYNHRFHYHLHESPPLVMAQNQSTSRRIPHPIDQRLVIEETKVSTLLLFLHSCFRVLRILFLYSTWKSEGCRGNRSFSSEKYWNWTFWTQMFWMWRRTCDKKLPSLPLSHAQDTYLWLGNFSYKCSVVKLQGCR